MRGEQLNALGRDLHMREQATLVAGATIMAREQLTTADVGRFAWQDEALCLQVDPDMFFLEKGGDSGKGAKKICAACPVNPECEAHAFSFDDNLESADGIWAGKNLRTRKKIRNTRGDL
jgi:hypothetical protein